MAGDRTDPTQSIKDYSELTQTDVGAIDLGDRAKTYLFGEDGPGRIAIVGKDDVTDGVDTGATLKTIAKTNDGRTAWGEENNGDGERREHLDLFDADGNVSDDFVALVEEAIEGDGGIGFLAGSVTTDSITLTVKGSWSTDYLKFDGGFVTQAFAEIGTSGLPNEVLKSLAVSDPSWYAETYGNSNINNGNNHNQIGVYEFNLADNESYYWSHDKNLSPEVQALFDRINSFFQDENAVAITEAALAEKYGLADTAGLEYCGDDGEAIVINLNARGSTVDTVVLHGDEIAAVLNGFGDDLPGGLDTGDGKSKVAYYNTDDNAGGSGGVWFGGGVNIVTFDAEGMITLNDVTGNGLTQKENKPNRQWQDDVDEFVFNSLEYNGDSDVTIIAGGQKGDDFMTLSMTTKGGNTDVFILEGERVGDAIDYWHDTGLQYDYFA